MCCCGTLNRWLVCVVRLNQTYPHELITQWTSPLDNMLHRCSSTHSESSPSSKLQWPCFYCAAKMHWAKEPCGTLIKLFTNAASSRTRSASSWMQYNGSLKLTNMAVLQLDALLIQEALTYIHSLFWQVSHLYCGAARSVKTCNVTLDDLSEVWRTALCWKKGTRLTWEAPSDGRMKRCNQELNKNQKSENCL